ncbi:MAG: bifunctional phosphopantothenoylcysteine decarboxylase/phosphopantothenate--cysteine ligase CoaBC [Phycicoccus sp.]|nr:bifunctional phosphopantothenoylcysteine decarboxylase/phosphopantothenate--cysteine ligase CoaBC [Phycicoccus sp.]NMM34080.1 bifunctional phosphopantothenoylcysteine decarboxylase/phosphopantothenate--cysteine ligase CoaBC [Phycicoccus sp.]
MTRKRVVLGVSGGIAAYKACSLLRLFTESGHDVTVVPTAAALNFVGAATWAALSGKPVATDVWTDVHQVPHVRLGQHADLVVVAPSTADLMAKAAHGLADDLLTNTLLTASCPVVLAPAMHTEMWEHPATVANVATLRSRGVHVIDPVSGRLTGADTGLGRLPEPQDIFDVCRELLSRSDGTVAATGGLAGRRVVISAGGTREPLDPVRFLGNRSSGKQGYALAEVALSRGADVTLISANVALPVPEGVTLVPVQTAIELGEAVAKAAQDCDVVVMAAAVADYRPAHYTDVKIKKTYDETVPESRPLAPTIELVRNPDVLAGLVQSRGSSTVPVIVGFAAETGDPEHSVLDLARAKFARKGCDVLVANEVGVDKTFGQDTNTVFILRRGVDAVTYAGPAPKDVVSATVWDVIQDVLSSG